MRARTGIRVAAGSSESRTYSRVNLTVLDLLAKLGTGVTGLGGLLQVGSTLLLGKLRESHCFLQT